MMSFGQFLLNIAAIACAGLILWRTEPALARMGTGTHWMIRYAMLTLAGGAIGVIITIIFGSHVDFITLLILFGIALLLACDRRLRYLVRHHRPGERHAA